MGKQKEADPKPQPVEKTPKPERNGTTEVGGRDGPEPTRYGDWEVSGRCVDF